MRRWGEGEGWDEGCSRAHRSGGGPSCTAWPSSHCPAEGGREDTEGVRPCVCLSVCTPPTTNLVLCISKVVVDARQLDLFHALFLFHLLQGLQHPLTDIPPLLLVVGLVTWAVGGAVQGVGRESSRAGRKRGRGRGEMGVDSELK